MSTPNPPIPEFDPNMQKTLDKLRKRKLFLGSPMYGGQCTAIYTQAVVGLCRMLTKMDMSFQMCFLGNEALITRARNYVVDEFMRSDATHLLFIDADIGFNPMDVLTMLNLQSTDPLDDSFDVIAAPYPKKSISWEKIKMAVEKGYANIDPANLANFVGDFVFNPIAAEGRYPVNQPIQVLEAGTGFMMIRRATFEKFLAAFPQYSYLPDHVRSENFDGTREIHMYFQAEIDPKTKRYLSEDYWFAQKCGEIGMKIYYCPWMRTTHMGSYAFSGSIVDLAQLGASPTADVLELRKIKDRAAQSKKDI